jgi:hypothetical protein
VRPGNGLIHSETCAVPAERFTAKQPLLRPLRERPAVATGERRRVDKCATVRVASARYSVPARLVGEWLEVAIENDEVRVLVDRAEVALHRRQAPGGASIDDHHYPTPAPTCWRCTTGDSAGPRVRGPREPKAARLVETRRARPIDGKRVRWRGVADVRSGPFSYSGRPARCRRGSRRTLA